MYYDDISEIEQNASCYTINSPTNIYSYRNNTRNTYTQIGSKWYKTAQSNYNTLPNNIVCVPYSTISTLSSNAQLTPVYVFCGLCISIAVLLGGFYLIFGRILKRGM